MNDFKRRSWYILCTTFLTNMAFSIHFMLFLLQFLMPFMPLYHHYRRSDSKTRTLGGRHTQGAWPTYSHEICISLFRKLSFINGCYWIRKVKSFFLRGLVSSRVKMILLTLFNTFKKGEKCLIRYVCTPVWLALTLVNIHQTSLNLYMLFISV